MGAEEITITGTTAGRYSEILTAEAVEFIVALDREFGARRVQVLERRRRRRATRTTDLDFLTSTQHVRDDLSWQVAPAAADLTDRRVEITGPPERKMTINALNSGAKVWMADFEDATSPTWENVILGQLNLRDALDGTLDYTAADGKRYEVGSDVPTIMVRPRGWHLPECHLRIGGRAVSASLFDFGLYLFHSGQRQIDRGSGPYFYLPKLESHLEARLWNDVFVFAQEYLGIPRGTIRATVLIETINAAFEMEEILYELREHSAGLKRGPLGLPVQHDQEPSGRDPARALAGHHDRAVHAGLHRVAGQDVPQARRPRDRRDGGGRAQQRPGRREAGPKPGAPGQAARGRRRLRRLLGRAPGPRRDLP